LDTVGTVPRTWTPKETSPENHPVMMFLAALLTFFGIAALLLAGLLVLVAETPSSSPSEAMNGLALLGLPPILSAGWYSPASPR